MDINLRWGTASGTQIYNNSTSFFNVTLNSGSTLNLNVTGANTGNACINSTGGTGTAGGTWTINGTMNIPGTLYATTSNNLRAAKWIIGNSGIVTCNYLECSASGTAGHEIEILDGGKLNLNTNNGFFNFSSTNNVYDFQDGSTVEYSSPLGIQTVKATIPSVFEYSNLLISTNGGTKQLAGNILVKRDLTITGGVLVANSFNINVGRNWENFGTNGFTEGTSGTVYFNGTSAQTMTCSGGEDFYMTDFSGAGTKTLLNDITVASNLSINSGSGALIANSNNVTVGGNWSNFGTAGFTEGTVGTVTFNGIAAQSITCAGGENFYNCNINNTSIGVTLNNSVNISNLLTLTSGKVHTGTNEMNVTSSVSNSIAGYQTDPSIATFILGPYINGNLRRSVATSGLYDFPIGTATNYEFVAVNLNSSSGINNIYAYFKSPVDGAAPNVTLNSTLITTLLNAGYWIISPDAYTAVDYDITASSIGHDNGGGVATQYTILKRELITDSWASLGTHNNATQTLYGSGASEVITAKRTSYSSFSHFGIAKGLNPLPIELLKFCGIYLDQKINLTWQTTSETNNDYFEIFKSKDLSYFEKLGTVAGAGNSNSTNTYSFIDENPYPGNNYYKLKQVDFDGNYSESNTILVKFLKAGELNIYYNNANSVIVSNTSNKIDVIEITDITGKSVIKLVNNSEESQLQINIDNITPGIYFVKVICNNESTVKKIFIE